MQVPATPMRVVTTNTACNLGARGREINQTVYAQHQMLDRPNFTRAPRLLTSTSCAHPPERPRKRHCLPTLAPHQGGTRSTLPQAPPRLRELAGAELRLWPPLPNGLLYIYKRRVLQQPGHLENRGGWRRSTYRRRERASTHSVHQIGHTVNKTTHACIQCWTDPTLHARHAC